MQWVTSYKNIEKNKFRNKKAEKCVETFSKIQIQKTRFLSNINK